MQQEKNDLPHTREPRKINSWLLSKNTGGQKAMGQYIQSVKGNKLSISNPAKLSFKHESELKTFLDKQKLKGYVAGRFTLQKLLKEVRHAESKWLLMVILINKEKYRVTVKVINYKR